MTLQTHFIPNCPSVQSQSRIKEHRPYLVAAASSPLLDIKCSFFPLLLAPWPCDRCSFIVFAELMFPTGTFPVGPSPTSLNDLMAPSDLLIWPQARISMIQRRICFFCRSVSWSKKQLGRVTWREWRWSWEERTPTSSLQMLIVSCQVVFYRVLHLLVALTRWSTTMVVLFSSHDQYLQIGNKHTWNDSPKMLKSFLVLWNPLDGWVSYKF